VFNIKQAATRLGVSVSSVRRLIASSALPHVRVGKLVRITEPDLEAFVASCRVADVVESSPRVAPDATRAQRALAAYVARQQRRAN